MIRQPESEINPTGDTNTNPTHMPLLTGVAGGGDFPHFEMGEFEQTHHKSLMNSQSVLLIILIAIIAGGTLYAMRLTQGDLNRDPVADDVEAKIDNAIAKLAIPNLLHSNDPLANLSVFEEDPSKVAELFDVDPTSHQVPIAYLKKNPFNRLLTRVIEDDSMNQDIVSNAQRSKRLQELQGELQTYELQTIMIGRRNVAVIDNNFFQQGSPLGSFVIESIHKLAVHLSAEGQNFELRLGTTSGKIP